MRKLLVLIAGIGSLLAGAPDARAAIGPGIEVDHVCTSNFVFRDATDLYLGTASHCFDQAWRPGGPACPVPAKRPGAQVTIDGASRSGTLAYVSSVAMEAKGEKDFDTCVNNDFALVRVHPGDHALVDPAMPQWGGPVGLRRADMKRHETMLSYGLSDVHGKVEPLRPREGYFDATVYGGWVHVTYFASMALFGDSGSGVLDGAGGAVGIVTKLEYPNATRVLDLEKALAYMRASGGPDARLVSSATPFRRATLPQLTASPPSEPEPPAEPRDPPPPPPPPAAEQQPPPARPAPPAGASSDPQPKPAAKPKAKRKPARRCRKTKTKTRRAAKCKRPARRR
jgi:hypothetical protein